jgi:hypothetical protein
MDRTPPMTPAEAELLARTANERDEALRRLRALCECRCDPCWTDRGLHAPECHADEGRCDDLGVRMVR